jgi:hypothetical protein
LVGALTVVAVMMCGERREHEASFVEGGGYSVSFSNVKQQKYEPSVLVIFTTFSSDIDHHRLAGRDEEVTASSAISARDTHKWYPLLFCH